MRDQAEQSGSNWMTDICRIMKEIGPNHSLSIRMAVGSNIHRGGSGRQRNFWNGPGGIGSKQQSRVLQQRNVIDAEGVTGPLA